MNDNNKIILKKIQEALDSKLTDWEKLDYISLLVEGKKK